MRGKEKTDEDSGHYVIASSRPPERPPLEIFSDPKFFLGLTFFGTQNFFKRKIFLRPKLFTHFRPSQSHEFSC